MNTQRLSGRHTIGEPAIVVGAGPAGLYAAFQLGLQGHRPVLVDSLSHAGGQCAALYPERMISDAPGFAPMSAADLTRALQAQLAPFAPLYLFGRRATALWGSLASGFNIETNTGETITGAAVIFAGGLGAFQPKRLAAAGVETISAGDLSFDAEIAADDRRVAVIGDGPAAVDAALKHAGRARSVTLIHTLPLRASDARIAALREAAATARVQVLQGEVERLNARAGHLSSIEIRGAAGRAAHEVDLLLVQAGLEIREERVTGLRSVVDFTTGETETPGAFIIGDAAPADGRAPSLAAGFADAIRAAETAHLRIEPPMRAAGAA